MVKSVCGMWYDHKKKGGIAMEFDPLYAPSLKEMFVRQLQDRILSGELAVNTKLPPERELVQVLVVVQCRR